VARWLQVLADVVPVLVLVACLSGTVGCVIPPDLQQRQQDAGANAPPIVVSVRDDNEEYPSPGPKSFVRGIGTARVTVFDVDASDTLYVQMFVQYDRDNPTPPRSTCPPVPPPAMAGNLERVTVCDVRALCTTDDHQNGNLFLEIEVYDRQPGNNGEPVFRDLPEGGQKSARSYLMACEEPPPS
jgi:hypothetical protein